ncbi:MAG: MATE family efflux transporter [Bacteroidales bacterium]|jgi:putative MATE family efflux protein|nr:MATE family efflux transporter [Bacteroidales bacterium]
MSEDKSLLLGRASIGSLLVQYALPAVVAMIASSLYNIIDSIFIGHKLGALAISGLALTFPFMNFGAAIGTLVGVGAATLTSIKLGEKDYHSARMVLGNVVVLNFILGTSFALLTIPFLRDILYLFGASNDTIDYAYDYMFIILFGNIFSHIYFGLNGLLRASGHPQKAMFVTLFSVGLNAVLAALFVLVFEWGISGAAWATFISQFLSLVWLILIFIKRNKALYFTKEIFKLKKKIVLQSTAIGLAPFLINAAASIVVIVINTQLQKYGGDLAIGAYGIINRISFIFLMVVMGITQGMQPIVGYNYGAKLYGRTIEVFKKGTILATMVMSLAFIVSELVPTLVTKAFTTDGQLISLSSIGFRIVFLMFPIVGFQIVVGNFFQSIGKAKQAIFLSLTRQVIILIPFLFILPQFLGLEGVWWSFPIADFIATIIAFFFIIKEIKYLKTLIH